MLLFDSLSYSFAVAPKVDGFIPLILVPSAVIPVLARHCCQELGHDSRHGALVGPDAAVSQSSPILQIFGSVEDLACDGEHAACETRKMF